jgi:hypothetical protein
MATLLDKILLDVFRHEVEILQQTSDSSTVTTSSGWAR